MYNRRKYGVVTSLFQNLIQSGNHGLTVQEQIRLSLEGEVEHHPRLARCLLMPSISGFRVQSAGWSTRLHCNESVVRLQALT